MAIGDRHNRIPNIRDVGSPRDPAFERPLLRVNLKSGVVEDRLPEYLRGDDGREHETVASNSQKRQIIECWKNGERSVNAIAIETGTSWHTVAKVLEEEGLRPRNSDAGPEAQGCEQDDNEAQSKEKHPEEVREQELPELCRPCLHREVCRYLEEVPQLPVWATCKHLAMLREAGIDEKAAVVFRTDMGMIETPQKAS